MLKSKIFIEYFYPLNFNFNAEFQKFNAEICFTPSYLELWMPQLKLGDESEHQCWQMDLHKPYAYNCTSHLFPKLKEYPQAHSAVKDTQTYM